MKYQKALFVLALVSIFSYQISSLVCWFWLDEIECNSLVQFICSAWDSMEYFVAHKVFAFLFYNAGYYGVIGVLCYNAEQLIMDNIGLNGSAMKWLYDIFGFVTSVIVGIVVGNIIGKYLYLNDLFDYLYHLIN